MLLLYFVITDIFSPGKGLLIPDSGIIFGTRFICVLLMHLQVEGDVRNGLFMMKYATNHPKEFFMPKVSWFLGFMQFCGALFCEFACVLFLSSIRDLVVINTVIKFVALGSIAKIDDFYAAALPEENKVKKHRGKAVMEMKNHRRLYDEDDERSCGVKFLSVMTKLLKMFFVVFVFYFMPFFTILIPYTIQNDSTPEYNSAEPTLNLNNIWA